MKSSEKQKISSDRVLFIYSTSHLQGSRKVRFFYSIKGRDDKLGLIRETKSRFLAKSTILAPGSKAELWRSFFRFWGCSFREIPLSYSGKKATHNLFVYKTSHLESSQLVNFFYQFKGRGKKAGILKKTKAELLAKSVVLVPATSARKLEDFFRTWKCSYEKLEVNIKDE